MVRDWWLEEISLVARDDLQYGPVGAKANNRAINHSKILVHSVIDNIKPKWGTTSSSFSRAQASRSHPVLSTTSRARNIVLYSSFLSWFLILLIHFRAAGLRMILRPRWKPFIILILMRWITDGLLHRQVCTRGLRYWVYCTGWWRCAR